MTGHEDFFTLGPETCSRGITMGEGGGERGEGRGKREAFCFSVRLFMYQPNH